MQRSIADYFKKQSVEGEDAGENDEPMRQHTDLDTTDDQSTGVDREEPSEQRNIIKTYVYV